MNGAAENSQTEAVVHEAIGSDLTSLQAGSAIGLGVVSLILGGVLPALLGALADEHRLSAQGIGICAMLEALSMGITTGIATVVLPPMRLRTIGVIATLSLAALDFAGIGASGTSIFLLRVCAGIAEGILLWIAVGMIVRSAVPDRWAGVLFLGTTSVQLAVALAYGAFVIPQHGADGGFVALGLVTLTGVAIALACPSQYAPLPQSTGGAGFPPARGVLALLATFIYTAAGAAVGIYLQPLAHEAGLSADVARTALSASLAAQIAGAGVATLLAGRLRYLPAFIITTVLMIGAWIVFASHPPAWAFVAANAVAGCMALFVLPFLVPMTIEADPTRKAASQSAGAQLFASAIGPLLASLLVSDRDAYGALVLGGALLLLGNVMIAGLHLVSQRQQARAI